MLPESNDELSQTLRQLKVAASTLDRDRLLFEAGRRSVRRSIAWPMLTAVSLLLAGISSLMVWQQPLRQQQETLAASTPVLQETIASLKPTNEPDESLLPFSYLALREESLTQKHPVLHT